MDITKDWYDPWPINPGDPNETVGDFTFKFVKNEHDLLFYWKYTGPWVPSKAQKYYNSGIREFHIHEVNKWQRVDGLNYALDDYRSFKLRCENFIYRVKDNCPKTYDELRAPFDAEIAVWTKARKEIKKEEFEKEARDQGFSSVKEYRAQIRKDKKDLVRVKRTQDLIDLAPVLRDIRDSADQILRNLADYPKDAVERLDNATRRTRDGKFYKKLGKYGTKK